MDECKFRRWVTNWRIRTVWLIFNQRTVCSWRGPWICKIVTNFLREIFLTEYFIIYADMKKNMYSISWIGEASGKKRIELPHILDVRVCLGSTRANLEYFWWIVWCWIFVGRWLTKISYIVKYWYSYYASFSMLRVPCETSFYPITTLK